jgi:hypothetical protein
VLTAALAAYERRRFAWLFATLLLTIGLYPSLRATFPGLDLLEPMLALNLAAALASAGRDHLNRAVALGALAAYAVLKGLQVVLGLDALLAAGEGVWVAGCLLAMGAAARYALRPGDVDAERIFAALDVYLLAGLTFGVAFRVVEQLAPGSFGGAHAGEPMSFVYFSFVTIATLGYGDIIPVSGPARSLTILEAVGGQMYLAVLVARLVSLYASRRDA